MRRAIPANSLYEESRSINSVRLNFFWGESGKEAALLPLPPLRTGLDGFPSSGSSRV
jgi:hypothetical protein